MKRARSLKIRCPKCKVVARFKKGSEKGSKKKNRKKVVYIYCSANPKHNIKLG